MRWKFSEGSAMFKARYNYERPEEGVSFHVEGPDGTYFDLQFCAPAKKRLTPGDYKDAERWPFQKGEAPGLNVSGNSWGNSTLWGEFTVHEIVYGPDGPSSFSVDFVQRDNDKRGPKMKGSLRYRAWHD